ncbi:MAG: GHMP kinase [Methylohalobius sp.]|nr:GHMP kinase [Methylohalobius sp.]
MYWQRYERWQGVGDCGKLKNMGLDSIAAKDTFVRRNWVKVQAPARLHLGFLDPSGWLGRKFGSVGVALEMLATEIEITPAQTLTVTGQDTQRVIKVTRKLLDQLELPDQVCIHVTASIPPHVGLGSGTQLALGVGAALMRFWGQGLDVRRIACLSGRGERSGIGIAAFERGGFVVDGGRGEVTITPPLLCRLPVPEDWHWLLVFDDWSEGLSGRRELLAFQKLPPFPREAAADLCHRLLIQGLPALAEERFEEFCACLATIQQANGEYFTPVQRGRYASPLVASALAWLQEQGWTGLGQSSWGPTGFCLLPDRETACQVKEGLEANFVGTSLRFQIVRSRNTGATILEG